MIILVKYIDGSQHGSHVYNYNFSRTSQTLLQHNHHPEFRKKFSRLSRPKFALVIIFSSHRCRNLCTDTLYSVFYCKNIEFISQIISTRFQPKVNKHDARVHNFVYVYLLSAPMFLLFFYLIFVFILFFHSHRQTEYKIKVAITRRIFVLPLRKNYH